MLLTVFAVAAVFVFVLGVPVVLLLRRLGRLGWKSVSVAGIAIGALPIAVLDRPGYAVDAHVAGIPATNGWLVYVESVVTAGALGLLSAIVFYAVWRRLGGARISAA